MALTERQQEVVDVIEAFWKEWGYAPSLKDIATRLGVTKSAAQKFVELLTQRGILTHTPYVARSLRVVRS